MSTESAPKTDRIVDRVGRSSHGGHVLMSDSVLRACSMAMLLPALVAAGCSIEGLPPDAPKDSLTGGAGGADASAEPPGGAGSSDESASAGSPEAGQTSTDHPGDDGASGAQTTGGSAVGGQDAAGGREIATGGDSDSMQTGGTSQGGSDMGGGRASDGGAVATGGASIGGSSGAATGGRGGAVGGGAAAGGRNTGGSAGSGGTATGGRGGAATGGTSPGGSGGAGTGGVSATGGSSAVDCSATMPTGGNTYTGTSVNGKINGLAYGIWTNGDGGSITVFPDAHAFSASWNNSQDFLAHLGLDFTNPQPYTTYGVIAAEFVEIKSGTAGGFSMIGMHGWMHKPCVEWYINEDSFGSLEARGNVTATIDGATYYLTTNAMNGTGGANACESGHTGAWTQMVSTRQTAHQCGTISVSDHFAAWEKQGWTLGSLSSVHINVEVGGGVGIIEFPVANVTVQ
jgi:hypothetical protein